MQASYSFLQTAMLYDNSHNMNLIHDVENSNLPQLQLNEKSP